MKAKNEAKSKAAIISQGFCQLLVEKRCKPYYKYYRTVGSCVIFTKMGHIRDIWQPPFFFDYVPGQNLDVSYFQEIDLFLFTANHFAHNQKFILSFRHLEMFFTISVFHASSY